MGVSNTRPRGKKKKHYLSLVCTDIRDQLRSSSARATRLFRLLRMARKMGSMEEELIKTKERLALVEDERDTAYRELTPMKLSQESSTGKVTDSNTELTIVKKSHESQELMEKDKQIESLKTELKRAEEMEAKLVEKEVCLQNLNEELIKVQSSKAVDSDLLSEEQKKIQELETDMWKGRESETKMMESFAAQTEHLGQTKVSLEESRLETKSLQQKLEIIDVSLEEKSNIDSSKIACLERQLESLKSSLELKEEECAEAQENEKRLLSNEKGLLEELNLLRNEHKSAIEAEEKSRKAMEDLAVALTEVAAEAKQTMEKLASTEQDLENSKRQLEKLKGKLKTVKEMYTEAKKEADTYKNTAERLRLEEEETHLAWSAKETGFVEYIRKAEEERDEALESIKVVEEMHRKAKEEAQKVRDILKQALNEANVAKEAAAIAREENSQLKDALAQKDKALIFLSQENEDLKINEAAAFDNIKELKRLLHEATTASDCKKLNPQKSMENDHKEDKEQGKKHQDEKEHKGGWRLSNTFSLKWQRHKEVDEENKLAHKESDENGKYHSSKLMPQVSPKLSPKGSPKLTPKASPKLSPQGSTKHSPLSSPKGNMENEQDDREHGRKQKDDKDHGRKLKPQGSMAIEQKDDKEKKRDVNKDSGKEKKRDVDKESFEDDQFRDSDPLKGSIFDIAETPNSSSELADIDGEATNLEDLDVLDPTHSDDAENYERNSTRKKALLRRFGDLIGSKSFHQRKVEQTLDQ